METSQILLENCQNDKHSLQIGQIKANFLYIYYKLSLDLSAFTMELQRMYSQRGKVLFPHWEAIIPTVGNRILSTLAPSEATERMFNV